MISRTTMNKQMKGNKMSPLPKPRPKNLKKKKIGDDLVAGFKSFFTGSKKKVPDNKKSPIRKLADAKKAKKESLDNDLAEIDKQSQIVALEAKLDKMDEVIEGKMSRINMVSEDENLSELVDSKKMKAMQKEVKILEKRKAKMEKMYEKMCGKSYTKTTEIVDEVDAINESVDLKDLMKNGKINNDVLVTTKPGAPKDDQLKNALRPKSIEDNSENGGPGAKLVRFADLSGGADKDYKIKDDKIMDLSLIEDK